MVRVTEELLKKRAEHNEGRLTNLEEIALHQSDIEKIEHFDILCRHIQILLLQNNLIEKMENLSKLKELKYLNLALNNITIIENIEGCECLEKLDMTCNFIDYGTYEESLINLRKAPSIRELYLMGNPVTSWPRYKDYAIAIVDQLEKIDGKDVLPSEKIKAKQNFDELDTELKLEAEKSEKLNASKSEEEKSKEYTRESRKKMYMELAKEKEEKENAKNPPKPKPKESSMYNNAGELRGCNEGGYQFLLDDWSDSENTIFTMKIPKYLDTSFIVVNIFPTVVSVRVKGKLTQIKMYEEVFTENASTQRSKTTGELCIKMRKVKPTKVYVDKTKEEQVVNIEKKNVVNQKDALKSSKENSFGHEKQNCEPEFDDLPDLE